MKTIKSLISLICILLFLLCNNIIHAQNAENVKGQILVKVKQENIIDLNYQIDNDNYVLLGKMPFIKTLRVTQIKKAYPSKNPEFKNVYSVFFDTITSSSLLTNEFLKLDFIEYAREIPIARIFYNFPDDFNESLQYNLQIINAPAAWNLVTSPHEIVIAIVDDAVNINHEDLINNIWVNQGEMNGLSSVLYQSIDINNDNEITSGEIYNYLLLNGNDYNSDGTINLTDALVPASPLTNSIDDEGNGYVDDFFGWDVAGNDNNPNPEIFNNYSFTHGTHVSGIAGAASNNNIGIASIGYNVKILPVKCALNGSGQLTNAQNGLVYVADVNSNGGKIHVVNMSWGGSTNSLFYVPYINVLHNQGVVMVASSGNTGSNYDEYPAYNNYVIAVGATDNNDIACDFSNRNDSIDVMAPGKDIFSSLSGTNSSYGKLTGTSMSAPLVSGLCALMLSYNDALTPAQVESCLKSGCDSNFSWYTNPSSPFYGLSGAGRINALKSLICVTGNNGPIANFSYNLNQTNCFKINLVNLSINANFWKWDFQNDGIVDATIQNPIATFTNYGSYQVKLEVSNDGNTWTSLIKTIYILPPTFEITTNTSLDACKDFPSYVYLTFTGTSPWTFEWYVNNTSQGLITTSNNPYELPIIYSDFGTKNIKFSFIHDAMCSNFITDSLVFNVSDCPKCSKEFNNWVFGVQNGIDFNNGILTSFVSNINGGIEGTSVISDLNGNLLFYSDGQKIWSKNHSVMANGNLGLNTVSVTNSSIIVKKPGSTSLYYVITNTAPYDSSPNHLFYSVVDISMNNGLGSVISGPTVLYNSDYLDEKMGLAQHSNGLDVWLLAHGNSTAITPNLCYSFLAFKISVTGIDNPVITVTSDYDNQHGGMKFSRDGSMFIWNLNYNATLFKFDKTTGVVSNPIRINGYNQDYTGFGAYAFGLEFSPDNTKLYASGLMNWSKTIQYDLTSNNEGIINSTKKIIVGDRSGALQLGPDMRIYCGNGFIIPNPNASYPDCGYISTSFPVGFLSLPAPVLHEECNFTINNNVQNDKVNVSVYPNPNKGLLNVELDKFEKNGTIEIYTILGIIVRKIDFSGYYKMIDISDLSEGIYLVKICSGKEITTKKIIKL